MANYPQLLNKKLHLPFDGQAKTTSIAACSQAGVQLSGVLIPTSLESPGGWSHRNTKAVRDTQSLWVETIELDSAGLKLTGLLGLRLQAFVIMGDPKITARSSQCKVCEKSIMCCKVVSGGGYLSTSVPQEYSMICDVDRRLSKSKNHYSFVEHRQLWGLLWACLKKGTDLYALYVLQCFAKVPPLWKVHQVC